MFRTNPKQCRHWLLYACIWNLSACTPEPADLKAWQQQLALQAPSPLPAWPSITTPYQLPHDAPTVLTLFDATQRLPTTTQQILTFYPVTQLHYVGYISTPTTHWAIIQTPQGPQLATSGDALGIEHWTLSDIDAKALTLTHPSADAAHLPISTAPAT